MLAKSQLNRRDTNGTDSLHERERQVKREEKSGEEKVPSLAWLFR